ncbi:hypothetical protein MASR2M78_07870 [Treponema sp.]
MKGLFFRRALVYLVLYVLVFLALVVTQFSQKTGFTLTIGSMAVSGRFEQVIESGRSGVSSERAISGELGVLFGGMEFKLSGDDGLRSLAASGKWQTIEPLSFRVEDKVLLVQLSDKSSLRFQTVFIDGAETLRVTASLTKGLKATSIPYKPLRSSRVAELKDGRTAIIVGEDSYAFNKATIDAEHQVLIIGEANPSFAYGKIIPKKTLSSTDLTLSQASDKAAYERSLSRWRDLAYSAWERSMAGSPDEETVVAYLVESKRRGTYRSAVATTPQTFVEGNSRNYRSAPFFGRLDEALRSLSAAERETLGRLSRLANERNTELFTEPDLVSFISLRASRGLVDDIATFARSIDPASISAPLATGFLEAWTDWKSHSRSEQNPFDKLLDQSRFVLIQTLLKTEGGFVFSFNGDKADLSFNLRTGRALVRYADAAGLSEWGDLGRSLILSCLSLADGNGLLPLEIQASSGAAPVASLTRLSSARVYKSLASETSFPHEEALPSELGPGLWAWTIASVSAIKDEEALDISVSFPAGETHYMLLRGIKPFTKIQLYGIDFRTDPRFERYDSSGWAYSSSEQTLLLKMKHKSTIEHIRIYF